jgi:hypothetical protein
MKIVIGTFYIKIWQKNWRVYLVSITIADTSKLILVKSCVLVNLYTGQ